VVIVDRIVLDRAVVPERQRPRLPAEPAGEFGAHRMASHAEKRSNPTAADLGPIITAAVVRFLEGAPAAMRDLKKTRFPRSFFKVDPVAAVPRMRSVELVDSNRC